MELLNPAVLSEDWDVVTSLLPSDWRESAYTTGALQRTRIFNPENLLRTLLIHLSDGCSMRETVARAKLGNIVSVSDVALLKRLNNSGEWFRYMSSELMKSWVIPKNDQANTNTFKEFRIRVIDGTTIQEPGATGTSWRVHYSVQLPTLLCDEVHTTDSHTGEAFGLYHVEPNDLFLADRGYANRRGINHIHSHGGFVIVRMNLSTLPLLDEKGKKLELLLKLKELKEGEIGDWISFVDVEGTRIKGRVCAIRKSNTAKEQAIQRAKNESQKKGHLVKQETLESAGYIFIFTTLGKKYTATQILELYRARWQIELIFKRLKSILGLGHLRKEDLYGARAWINGKLFVAFLIESLVQCGESFFPWGFRIQEGL